MQLWAGTSGTACLLSIIGIAVAADGPVPLPPSVDPFYQPPPGLADTAPGTILRSRVVEPPSVVDATTRAYQLLFRSTDSQNQPAGVVTTFLVPENASCQQVLSLQFAYDSPAIDCAPSYIIRSGTATFSEAAAIPPALDMGWCINIPDFEGFGGAFTNGLQSGFATLDSVRAILTSSNVTGTPSSAKVALAGGSGGAIGSEWALELMDQYAPELQGTIIGTLLTALVPNVTSTYYAVDGTISAGLIPSAVLGLAKQYSSLADWLSGVLLPSQASSVLAATSECADKFVPSFAFRRASSYLTRPTAIQEDIPQSVLREVGIMGFRAIPSSPIFVYKGTNDPISPVVDSDTLINKYCARGARIEYERATNAGHALAGVYGFQVGYPWLADRFAGDALPSQCNITDVTVPLDFILAHPELLLV